MTNPAATATASAASIPVPLQDSEQVLMLCRRHWIYLWPQIAIYLLLAVIPPVMLGVLLDQAGGFHGMGEKIFWVVAWTYLGYWLVRIFLSWYRYRHDIWAITNQRLIDGYKRHPFSLRVSTVDLVNVQDMTIQRDGLLRTMLDYGDIVCQTAAEQQDFRLTGIPDPRKVQSLVDRERDRERLRVR
jgi:hypothetical protein